MDEMTRLVDRLASVDQRLRMLEGGARVGLSGIRSAWGTAAADPTVFGAYESGPTGSTWTDDAGGTGTGYPSLTLVDCPARYMILWSVRPINVAVNTVSSYRCSAMTLTVAVGGVDVPVLPNARRLFQNLNTGTVDQSMAMIVVRRDAPGTKTFQMRALWNDSYPAGTILPRLTDIYLGVLPLSVA